MAVEESVGAEFGVDPGRAEEIECEGFNSGCECGHGLSVGGCCVGQMGEGFRGLVVCFDGISGVKSSLL